MSNDSFLEFGKKLTYAETYLTVDVVYRERKWFMFDLYNLSVVETGDANI